MDTGHATSAGYRQFAAMLCGLGLVLCLVPYLGGCGFQLRGSEGASALPSSWQSMHFDSASPNSELSRVVYARFTASGIQWQPRGTAAYRLQLGPERFEQRNLSVNAQARAAEFELLLRATFSVLDREGKVIMPAETALIAKQMENDPLNVVGKAEEIRILREEMRVELAQQIIRRIAYFAASHRPDAA